MFKTGDHYAMPGHDHEAAREWVKGYCVKPAPWKGQSNIHTLCYLLRDVLSDYDALQARVKQVVEEGRAISRLNVQQAVEIGGLQARVRELEAQLEMREQQAIVREPLIVGQQERIAQLEQQVQHYQDCDEHRQKEWQADLDRLHQAEAENAALRAELAHSREREEMHSQ